MSDKVRFFFFNLNSSFHLMQTGLADSQSVLGEDQQETVELTRPDMTKRGLSDDVKMERGGGVKWL